MSEIGWLRVIVLCLLAGYPFVMEWCWQRGYSAGCRAALPDDLEVE